MHQKILVVDDEISIVTLLAFHLEKAGFAVEKAYDGLQALEKVESEKFDFMVLDLMLPKISGTELCEHLRDHHNDIPILMLTAKGEEMDKISGLDIGADDYMTKPFSPKEVVARVNAVLRRTKGTDGNDSNFIEIGAIQVFPERFEAIKEDNIVSFTRKEFELLHYLAKHQGIVLSRDRLLLAVWNYDFVGDSRIVDVHISRLREKLEADSKNPKYIKTIRGLGYKMEAPVR